MVAIADWIGQFCWPNLSNIFWPCYLGLVCQCDILCIKSPEVATCKWNKSFSFMLFHGIDAFCSNVCLKWIVGGKRPCMMLPRQHVHGLVSRMLCCQSANRNMFGYHTNYPGLLVSVQSKHDSVSMLVIWQQLQSLHACTHAQKKTFRPRHARANAQTQQSRTHCWAYPLASSNIGLRKKMDGGEDAKYDCKVLLFVRCKPGR